MIKISILNKDMEILSCGSEFGSGPSMVVSIHALPVIVNRINYMVPCDLAQFHCSILRFKR